MPWNKCGDKADNFIGSNGTIASPFEYPWMALITNQTNLKPGKSFKAFCGGFLISDRYVLTSAHCVHDTTDRYTNLIIFSKYSLIYFIISIFIFALTVMLYD